MGKEQRQRHTAVGIRKQAEAARYRCVRVVYVCMLVVIVCIIELSIEFIKSYTKNQINFISYHSGKSE